jgi:hypothetical protein
VCFAPSRVEVPPFLVVPVTPRILGGLCKRNLTRATIRLECFASWTNDCRRLWDVTQAHKTACIVTLDTRPPVLQAVDAKLHTHCLESYVGRSGKAALEGVDQLSRTGGRACHDMVPCYGIGQPTASYPICR